MDEILSYMELNRRVFAALPQLTDRKKIRLLQTHSEAVCNHADVTIDHLKAALFKAHVALKRYEMDVDESPTRDHRALMDEIESALKLVMPTIPAYAKYEAPRVDLHKTDAASVPIRSTRGAMELMHQSGAQVNAAPAQPAGQ